MGPQTGQKRAFVKFTRVGGADHHHTEGTSLGLYVARQMIREIGGDIWAESAGEGKGSTFTVKLPAEGSPQALKAGTKLTVGIKAAEAGEKSGETSEKGEASAKLGEDTPKRKAS